MSELTEERLKQLIRNHEGNFQKHLLGLDSTGNLFKYCIEYIDKLENQLLEYKRREVIGRPRCLAWENGIQCKNLADKIIRYDGDPTIYKKHGVTTSVIVGFCVRHIGELKAKGIDFNLNYYMK